MDYLTDDLWAMILARLPIKIFTGLKLVCKQWKSVLESPIFRDVFMSMHQNSPSSPWSLISKSYIDPEMVGHYQCDTWGLNRSLGSFIKSFLADIKQKHKYLRLRISVEAYSDVGLILIHVKSNIMEKGVIYVANPVSRECVDILFPDPLPIGFERKERCWQWGLVTRTAENGHLLDYKVVLVDKLQRDTRLSRLIYSSETGLWSLETFRLPYSFHYHYSSGYPISLNGNLHWLALNRDHDEVVLSMDMYATSTGSDQCRVTPFPDLEKTTKFKRFCTPCQGLLHYMNIVDGSKLCLWRLQSEGWQLISEISPCFCLTCLDYLPLMINPLDAKTAYFWSTNRNRLLAVNLYNGEKFVIHKQREGKSDGRTTFSVNDPKAMISLKIRIETSTIPFILPQWLHRIPNTVST